MAAEELAGAGLPEGNGSRGKVGQFMSEQVCDVGRGIELCYETFGDPATRPRC